MAMDERCSPVAKKQSQQTTEKNLKKGKKETKKIHSHGKMTATQNLKGENHMNKAIKRVLAMLLAAVLLCGGLAVGASAATNITAAFTDANFKAAVYDWIDKPASAPIYDTDVAGIDYLYVGYRDIQSLNGLEYFTSLQELNCYNNQLTALPTLPSSLEWLDCGDNQLTALPALPIGLRWLFCNNNQLMALPALPGSLQSLGCANNQLTALPTLPSGLVVLSCESNQLAALPTLPSNLDSLDCSGNQLTTLLTLPSNLNSLDCSGNQLTTLPALPNNLGYLRCERNKLTALNVTGLQLYGLDCRYNDMPSIPAITGFTGTWDNVNFRYSPQNADLLTAVDITASFTDLNFRAAVYECIGATAPAPIYDADVKWETSLWACNKNIQSLAGLENFVNLLYLDCPGNQLTALPALPSGLITLECAFNKLTALPALPNSLRHLNCSNREYGKGGPSAPDDPGNVNQLVSLPALPPGLETLYCAKNKLTSLPTLPTSLTGMAF